MQLRRPGRVPSTPPAASLLMSLPQATDLQTDPESAVQAFAEPFPLPAIFLVSFPSPALCQPNVQSSALQCKGFLPGAVHDSQMGVGHSSQEPCPSPLWHLLCHIDVPSPHPSHSATFKGEDRHRKHCKTI